jgi:REP element-mobilizing transposase RayT
MQSKKVMSKQFTLEAIVGKNPKLRFGGDLMLGKRKEERVLASRRPIHLVMRSPMARGSRSMLRKARIIEKLVREHAKKQHIKITDYVNVGNHLHLVIEIYPRGDGGRECFKRFIRSTSGLIARRVLSAERGAAKLATGEKFWPARPYTRVLSQTKSDYANLHNYITINMLEAIGFDRSTYEQTPTATSSARYSSAQAAPPI